MRSIVRSLLFRIACERAHWAMLADCLVTELSLTDLEVPYMRDCFRRWDQTRRGLPLPLERHADPLSVTSAQGCIGLIDVERSSSDFSFRYVGPLMAIEPGQDYTGRRVSDLRPPSFAAVVRRACERILRDRVPILEDLRFSGNALKRDYVQLLMPLSNEAGDVATIWAVTHYRHGPDQAALHR